MLSEIAILPRRISNSFPAEIRPTGLILDEGITLEAWAGIGAVLEGYDKARCWLAGDWIRIGAERFHEEHSAALGDHYNPTTLTRYRRVCEAFPFERRREALSFEHHSAVYKLPEAEREELLDLAEASEWGRAEMRAEVERRHPKRPIGTGGEGRVSGKPGPAPVGNVLSAALVQSGAGEVYQLTTVEDAVDLLSSLPPGALPENVTEAILMLTEERPKLVRVRDEAARVLSLYTPEEAVAYFPRLAEAVEAVRNG